ncbi:hypothetical protein PM10SUCC1_19140 [Propionigenium maris DSM 9537]|uniref:AAA domain-containing protein n=1 Tax=Propionigenium maris DSM 9537 TaxID=1123000 RepID=A0A9W6GM01_9FUSO|nr:hypothetical protein [Propionigenium maris]GLI56400.1 hypothetical protein PM10SUCC1_19140 [Propionigenium maris DSM 9537]
MDFIINKFVILSPEEMKALTCEFKEKINLIVGKKDTGKTTLSRSIMYTLGCDVKNFDFKKKLSNNIYILDFKIGSDSFILIRKKLKSGKGKNFFRVIKNKKEENYFYDTKDFKEYLNEILNIKCLVLDKYKNITKLYPNHIFLPFYIDQDSSWQDYLKSTFEGINFIEKYKKVILEYFTGIHSNEFYELDVKRKKLKNERLQLEALITSKEKIRRKNEEKVKIIESIDWEEFKEQYLHYLALHQSIIDVEHELKKELNEKIFKKNSLLGMKKKIESSIVNILGSKHSEECPNCNQKIHLDMDENYKLYLTEQNLIKEKEVIALEIRKVEEEISKEMAKMKEIRFKDVSMKEKLNSDSQKIQLKERAESFAFTNINLELSNEILELEKDLEKTEEELEIVMENLKKLDKNNVSEEYISLMQNSFDKLGIMFEFNTRYDSNLESAKISLSGTSKAQAFIAQYLTIYEIFVKRASSAILPMFIDTYLKEDSNENEIEKTSKFIFDSLKDKHQSFVYISDNSQTLEAIKDFNYNLINLEEERELLNEDYDEVYSKYSHIIR